MRMTKQERIDQANAKYRAINAEAVKILRDKVMPTLTNLEIVEETPHPQYDVELAKAQKEYDTIGKSAEKEYWATIKPAKQELERELEEIENE